MCTHPQVPRAPQRRPEVSVGREVFRPCPCCLLYLRLERGWGISLRPSSFSKGKGGHILALRKSWCSRDSDAHQISSYLPRRHVAKSGSVMTSDQCNMRRDQCCSRTRCWKRLRGSPVSVTLQWCLRHLVFMRCRENQVPAEL